MIQKADAGSDFIFPVAVDIEIEVVVLVFGTNEELVGHCGRAFEAQAVSVDAAVVDPGVDVACFEEVVTEIRGGDLRYTQARADDNEQSFHFHLSISPDLVSERAPMLGGTRRRATRPGSQFGEPWNALCQTLSARRTERARFR